MKTIIIIFNILVFSGGLYAENKFSVEDYSQLPEVRSVSISPDGKLYGYIHETKDDVRFNIVDISKNEIIISLDTGTVNPNAIFFASNEYVILSGKKNINGRWRSASWVYSLKTRKMEHFLKTFDNVNLTGAAHGQAVGTNTKENIVYVPAFFSGVKSPNHLLKVSLETGVATKIAKGNPYTVDWFMNDKGQVLAREDYNYVTKEHKLWSLISGKWQIIFSQTVGTIESHFSAVSSDFKKIIFTKEHASTNAIFTMSLEDGEILGPFLDEPKSDIREILKNRFNQVMTGVLYSGLLPNYQYQDLALQANIAAIQETFPGSAVHPISITLNNSHSILKVSGNEGADEYFIFDANAKKIKPILQGYPAIKKDDIAEITAIKYKARDGLSINAIVTWPIGVTIKKDLPLLVFPHDGPETYSSISFNWWVQYFSRKGYMILQPNFRGSTGFGLDFRNAGRRKWGEEMQHDITDGVNSLIKSGYVDSSRICIMGASYGGYAALAGGAFTPNLYRCVVSVSGMSDIPKMLKDNKKAFGDKSTNTIYLKKIVGDINTEYEKLEKISPINYVDSFKAPLLLVYSKSESSRAISQSKRMASAMKKSNNTVELVAISSWGHWKTDSDKRLELLKVISDFLNKYNPVNIDENIQ